MTTHETSHDPMLMRAAAHQTDGNTTTSSLAPTERTSLLLSPTASAVSARTPSFTPTTPVSWRSRVLSLSSSSSAGSTRSTAGPEPPPQPPQPPQPPPPPILLKRTESSLSLVTSATETICCAECECTLNEPSRRSPTHNSKAALLFSTGRTVSSADNDVGDDEENCNRHNDDDGDDDTTRALMLQIRLQELQFTARLQTVLSVLCVVYGSVNVVLLGVNYLKGKYDYGPAHQPGTPDVVGCYPYHLIEFWATFGFAMVEYFAFVGTPTTTTITKIRRTTTPSKSRRPTNTTVSLLLPKTTIPRAPALQAMSPSSSSSSSSPQFDSLFRMVLYCNLVFTLLPAIMVTLALEDLEVVSHEIEYSNELLMTGIDMFIAVAFYHNTPTNKGRKCRDDDDSAPAPPGRDEDDGTVASPRRMLWLIITVIAGLVAIVQLWVYNVFGHDEATHHMQGEIYGHYFEFGFEIISSVMTYYYCRGNTTRATQQLETLLLLASSSYPSASAATASASAASLRSHTTAITSTASSYLSLSSTRDDRKENKQADPQETDACCCVCLCCDTNNTDEENWQAGDDGGFLIVTNIRGGESTMMKREEEDDSNNEDDPSFSWKLKYNDSAPVI